MYLHFYIGGFHRTPRMGIVFPIHTLHLFYHGWVNKKEEVTQTRYFHQTLEVRELLNNFESIRVNVLNFTFAL
jgi:hypothetical protein